ELYLKELAALCSPVALLTPGTCAVLAPQSGGKAVAVIPLVMWPLGKYRSHGEAGRTLFDHISHTRCRRAHYLAYPHSALHKSQLPQPTFSQRRLLLNLPFLPC